MKSFKMQYSGTSLNGHLITQDEMLQSRLNLITLQLRNSLDNADAGRPLAQDCPAPLIDSPTGHYINIGMHSSSLWLSFLGMVQQERALECAFVALNGTSTHCHTYRKYTGSLQSRDTSLLRTLQMAPLVSALKRFHCI